MPRCSRRAVLTHCADERCGGQVMYVERRFNGVLHPAEVHFVHQSTDSGKYLVVGVFIKQDSPPYATAFDELLLEFPTKQNLEPKSINFDYTEALTQILGASTNTTVPFYKYDGSFTTPPCTEAVNWVVSLVPNERYACIFCWCQRSLEFLRGWIGIWRAYLRVEC